MARYTADVSWALRAGEDFAAGRYSRRHAIGFDGGTTVPGAEALGRLHHEAHGNCFIANSVEDQGGGGTGRASRMRNTRRFASRS